MDRGEQQRDERVDAFDGVADETSRRVREVLAESERHARELDDEAGLAGAAVAEGAAEEAERLFEDARAKARQVARDRADHLAAIQASLTARGPAVLEGLEGAGATRAGIEALIAALAETAERVLAEADAGEPRGSAAEADGSTEQEPDDEASDDSGETSEEVIVDAVVVDDPVEDAEDAVSDADATVSSPVEEDDATEGDGAPAAEPVAFAGPDGNGSGRETGDGAAPYEGTLPEGAPMVRRPERTRERDVRFSALILALQGRDRGEVEERLRTEHDVKDPAPILDEVFGRADARA